MKLSLNLPAGENARWSQEAADGLVGQRFHVLAFGESYLARVTHAELYDQGASVQLSAEVETPEEEDIPEPVFTTTAEERGPDLADDDCLRLAPDVPRADCPATGSPRCHTCIWQPAEEAPNGEATP